MTVITPRKDIHVLMNQQAVEDTHLELVAKARKFADTLGGSVCGIALGHADEKTVDELSRYGADAVWFIESPMLSTYRADSSEFYVEALSNLLKKEKPWKLLCTDDLLDRDLACRVAARLAAGLITGCVDLSMDENGVLTFHKPAYLGRLISTFTCPRNSLTIITVKTGAFDKAPDPAKSAPDVRIIQPELESIPSPLKTLDMVKAGPEEIGLDEADIIVTGGRGMGSAENFKLLYQLAGYLGGTVAGSLGAVEAGWISRSKLVGQTGTTVEPKVYIACGVSGSIYHLVGMRESKIIVAINKDRFAPIFKYADFGMVGDAMTVLPSIIDSLAKAVKS